MTWVTMVGVNGGQRQVMTWLMTWVMTWATTMVGLMADNGGVDGGRRWMRTANNGNEE